MINVPEGAGKLQLQMCGNGIKHTIEWFLNGTIYEILC